MCQKKHGCGNPYECLVQGATQGLYLLVTDTPDHHKIQVVYTHRRIGRSV